MRVLRLVGAGALAGTLLVSVMASVAAAAEMVGPGQLVELQSAPVALRTPADGRLRGYGFAAEVTGVAHGQALGGLVTGAGRQLWVFSLTYAVEGENTDASLQQVAGQVQVGSRALTFDPDTLQGGGGTFALSAPAGAAVSVELSSDDYTQGFSLNDMARLAPAPGALYRDPSSFEVRSSPDTTATLSATNPADGVSGQVTATLNQLELSFFDPADPSVHASDPASAYLQLSLADQAVMPPGQSYLDEFTPVPASDVQLELPGGTTIPSTWARSPGYAETLLSIPYVFVVPADLTSATLVIAPGTEQGAEFTYTGAGSPASANFDSVQMPLTIPPVASPQSEGVSAPTASAGAAKTPAASSAVSPLPYVIGAVVLMAILVLFGEELWRRRPRVKVVGPEAIVRPALLPGPAPRSIQPIALPASAVPAVREVIDVEVEETGPSVLVELEAPVQLGGASGAPVEPEPEPQVLKVAVMGGPEVTAGLRRWSRRVEEELCILLALLNGRACTIGEIAEMVWPNADITPANIETLRKYLSYVRADLPDGWLPDATGGAGYRILGPVETDWGWFRELQVRAKAATGAEKEQLLEAALSLVRGQPFSGVKTTKLRGREPYAWAAEWINEMEVAIEEAAHELWTLRQGRGANREAASAASVGLRGVPYSRLLRGDHLEATFGDLGALAAARRAAEKALGEEPVEAILEERGLRP